MLLTSYNCYAIDMKNSCTDYCFFMISMSIVENRMIFIWKSLLFPCKILFKSFFFFKACYNGQVLHLYLAYFLVRHLTWYHLLEPALFVCSSTPPLGPFVIVSDSVEPNYMSSASFCFVGPAGVRGVKRTHIGWVSYFITVHY